MKPDHGLDTQLIAKELLLGILPRGDDATGAAWFSLTDQATVQKAPGPANKFIDKLRLGKHTNTAILHTRLATRGTWTNNANNHPIVAVGETGHRVIGTHSGTLSNPGRVERMYDLKLAAEVDSEVLFAALTKFGDTYNWMEDVLGNVAAAYIREDRPDELFLFRGSLFPLVLMETDYGWFYASDEETLDRIHKTVGGPLLGYTEVYEGRNAHLKDGELVETGAFDFDDWNSFSTYDYDWEDRFPYVTTVRRGSGGSFRVRNVGSTGYRMGTSGWSNVDSTGNGRPCRTYFSDVSRYIERVIDLPEDTTVAGAFGTWARANWSVDFYPYEGLDVEDAALEELTFRRTHLGSDWPKELDDEVHDLTVRVGREDVTLEVEPYIEEAIEDQGTTPTTPDDEALLAGASLARMLGHGEASLLDGADVALVEGEVWMATASGGWNNTQMTEDEYWAAQIAMAEEEIAV